MNSQFATTAAASVTAAALNGNTLLTSVNAIRTGLLDEKCDAHIKSAREVAIKKMAMTHAEMAAHLRAPISESCSHSVLQNIISYTQKLDAHQYVKRAKAWIDVSCFREAMLDVGVAIALDSKNPEAFYLEAKILFMLEDFSQADSSSLREAIRLNNLRTDVSLDANLSLGHCYLLRAKIYFAQKKYQETLEAAELAITYNIELIDEETDLTNQIYEAEAAETLAHETTAAAATATTSSSFSITAATPAFMLPSSKNIKAKEHYATALAAYEARNISETSMAARNQQMKVALDAILTAHRLDDSYLDAYILNIKIKLFISEDKNSLYLVKRILDVADRLATISHNAARKDNKAMDLPAQIVEIMALKKKISILEKRKRETTTVNPTQPANPSSKRIKLGSHASMFPPHNKQNPTTSQHTAAAMPQNK